MAMMSPMAAGAEAPGQGSGPAPPDHPLVSGMGALTDMSKARFDKLAAAKSMLDKVGKELAPLGKLGDLVSQDDVIKAAGKIVGHGLGAAAVAGILADMPPDGQALGAWVTQHLQGIQQREAQLAPVLAQARHEMGVHALQLLAAHHMANAPAQGPQAGPSPPVMAPGDGSLSSPTPAPSAGGPNAS